MANRVQTREYREQLPQRRRAKQAAVEILLKLQKDLGQPKAKTFRKVATQVSQISKITPESTELAWNNFVKYGYYDGHDKSLKFDRATKAYNKVYRSKSAEKYRKTVGKLTYKRALNALCLWIIGTSNKENFECTKVGTDDLYPLIHEFAEEGKILNKTVHHYLFKNIITSREHALKRYVHHKPNRKIEKKRMLNTYYTALEVLYGLKANINNNGINATVHNFINSPKNEIYKMRKTTHFMEVEAEYNK